MAARSLLFLCGSALALQHAWGVVTIGRDANGPCLLVDGSPHWVKGVTFTIDDTPDDPDAQEKALRDVKAMGANTIRTWGVGDRTGKLLDTAHALGLKVMLGLWLEHGRPGNEGDGDMNYAAHGQRADKHRDRILRQVRAYMNHPALLVWGVGNEVILNISTEAEKVAYAKYLERVCRDIKALDPNHPVMSVSAWTVDVPYWKAYTPSLDGYGVNAYGPAAGAIPDSLAELDAVKPYLVTEFGPRGAYDSPKDENGVAVEPTDKEKYDQILKGWRDWVQGNRARGCLGAFVFNYGSDWNPTSVWLDLFVSGNRRPAYWATLKAFSGLDPETPPVRITSFLVEKGQIAGEWIRARVECEESANAPTGLLFVAAAQSGSRDEKNRMIPLTYEKIGEIDYRVRAPKQPGVYRIYAIATDARGSMASASRSLNVKRTEASAERPEASLDRASAVAPAAGARGRVVEITGDAERGYALLRNGKPFVIKGVGGEKFLDVLSSVGGNAIRTWGADAPDKIVNGKRMIDWAHENGIAVTIGIWLGHERHGFSYTSPQQIKEQRERVREAVLRFRDHPATLIWGLGNEMEGPTGPGTNPDIWKEINVLAKLIKELDPNHPVMPVLANVSEAKVAAIRQYAPDIDILGVNAYAGAGGVGRALVRAGWTKPYTICEFGLPGPWEVDHTSWNAPIEPGSRQKAAMYYTTYNSIMEDTRQCLGSYAFLWGNKQEATASWFGMFLPGGEKLGTVDAMGRAWSGEWPTNRAPVLGEVSVPFAQKIVKPGQALNVRATYRDPDGDRLTYHWDVFAESTDRRTGGEDEAKPEAVPDAITHSDEAGAATLRVPDKPGAYRLFVTVKDGHGSGAIDNWPFLVTP